MRMMEFQKPKTEELDIQQLLNRNKNEDKKEDVEWEPAAILNCCYFNQDCSQVLISSEGLYGEFFYVVDFDELRPI